MKCNNKAIHILNHGWEDIFSLYFPNNTALFIPHKGKKQTNKANKQTKNEHYLNKKQLFVG